MQFSSLHKCISCSLSLIQVDFGEPTSMETIDTQGGGQSGYVESFYVAYSNDAMYWHFSRENNLFKVPESSDIPTM